ncbi:hypothetical protein GGF50DRAFT_107948 [Schizophyllum commune]
MAAVLNARNHGLPTHPHLFQAPSSMSGRSTPLPKRQTAAVINRFFLEMATTQPRIVSQATVTNRQTTLFEMLENMVIEEQSPLPDENFPSSASGHSRRPSIDSGISVWEDALEATGIVLDRGDSHSTEVEPAIPSSNLSGRFSPRALSMVSRSSSSRTLRPATEEQRSKSKALSIASSHSQDRSAVEAEERFGVTSALPSPTFSVDTDIYPPARDYDAIRHFMAKRVVDWRGNKIEKFGRLLIADQLVVTREGVDYDYLVYVFDRIVVFAADSKTGGRLRQCLVGRKAYDPFFKAGTRSTPLKMKGSVYMACVMGAVPLSEDRVPCDCKAGRPAFVSPASTCCNSFPLLLQFTNDDGELEKLTLHLPTEDLRERWLSAIDAASSQCAKNNGSR